MKQYKEFEETLYNQEHDIEAVNKGVLTNKLLQFCNGGQYKELPPIPTTLTPSEVIFVHDLKLKALESIIAEAAGKPVLIAYSYKFDKAQIKKRFKGRCSSTRSPISSRNGTRVRSRSGVSHPASIGHGLNLQHGGHIQCWYELLGLWSLGSSSTGDCTCPARRPRPCSYM